MSKISKRSICSTPEHDQEDEANSKLIRASATTSPSYESSMSPSLPNQSMTFPKSIYSTILEKCHNQPNDFPHPSPFGLHYEAYNKPLHDSFMDRVAFASEFQMFIIA